jgi:gamma-glutamyltranspeptidase / glutathione hydrolase
VDHGDDLQSAETLDALRARFDYDEARRQNNPLKFACPSVAMRQGDANSGATDIFQPWGDAVAEA